MFMNKSETSAKPQKIKREPPRESTKLEIPGIFGAANQKKSMSPKREAGKKLDNKNPFVGKNADPKRPSANVEISKKFGDLA